MTNFNYKIQNLLQKFLIIAALLGSWGLYSCTDVVNVDVQNSGTTQLVVDGFVGNQPNTAQIIKLSLTQPYFDNSIIKPALGAIVYVTDEDGKRFDFKDLKNDGNYTWQPLANQSFGAIGKKYNLSISYNGEEYSSVSTMNRVPKIDSVVYEYKTTKSPNQINGPTQGYLPEFYARDFTGVGDCYWIKSAKNSAYFSKSSEISIAYDASFNAGDNIDGLVLIRPLRQSIAKELFADKDTLKVELYSITSPTFYFFQNVQVQSRNAGIFATPTANVPSNIKNKNVNSTKTALGFFSVSAVSTFQTIIDKNKAKPSTN